MPRFVKGLSGNPAGKLPGTKDKHTRLRELLLPHAETLIAQAVALALKGDVGALRICIDRLLPPLRPTCAPVSLSLLGTPSQQGRQTLTAMAAGRLPPDTAVDVIHALEAQVRLTEATEIEQRIAALEAA